MIPDPTYVTGYDVISDPSAIFLAGLGIEMGYTAVFMSASLHLKDLYDGYMKIVFSDGALLNFE